MIKKSSVLLFVFLFIFFGNTDAQNKKIDSLKGIEEKQTDINEKAWLFLEIGQNFFNFSNYDSAYFYFHKSHKLYKKSNNQKGISDIYLQYALIKEVKSDYDSTFYYYDKSAEIKERINDIKGLGRVYSNIGVTYYYKGDYYKAIDNYFKSISYKKRINDSLGLAASYNNLSLAYSSVNNYDKAIKSCISALEIYDKYPPRREKINALISLGNIYLGQKQYKKSAECYLKCENDAAKLKDTLALTVAKLNSGCVNIEIKKFDSAIKQLKEAKALAERKKMYESLKANILQNLGLAYIKISDFNNAYDYIVESNKYYKNLGDEDNKSIGENYIAEILIKQNKLKAAGKILKNILNNKHIIDKKNTAQTYHSLSILYNKKFDYKKAYHFLSKYYKLNDSLTEIKNKKQITELQIKYQTAEKEKENQKLQYENKLQKTKIAEEKKIRNFYLFALISALIFILIIFIQLRKKDSAYKFLVKRNNELTEKEQELKAVKEQLTHSAAKRREPVYNDEKKEELLTKIENEFDNNNIYKEDISLKKLAEKLNTNTSYLSGIFNTVYKKGFSDFVNSYRIKEAVKLFDNPDFDKLSTDAIGIEAGFNSGKTFVRVFKKQIGVTPSYYRKHNR